MVPNRLLPLWSRTVTGAVWDLAMPAEASFLAVASGISSGKTRQDLTGEVLAFDRTGSLLWSHQSATGVSCVDTPADGSLIVAASNKEARVFTKSGELLWTHEMPSRVSKVSVDSKGEIVVAASANRVDILSRAGNLRWSRAIEEEVVDIAVSPTGQLLAIASWEWPGNQGKPATAARGLLSVFDASGSLRWRHEVRLAPGDLELLHMPIAIASNEAILAFGTPSADGRLHIFRSDGQPLWKDSAYADILELAASDDCSIIALGSGDFQLLAYDGPRGRAWTRGTGGDPVHWAAGDFALAVSPDGGLIAAGAGDGDLYVFGREGNLLLKKPMMGYVRVARFSADGSVLAAGSRDGNVELFEIKASRTSA